MRLTIEAGALLTVPVWEPHERGRNWFAKITRNPLSAGAIERAFARRAKGEFYYIVPKDLAVGDAVEFGADYYTSGGFKNPKRWYGVVTLLTDEVMEVFACPTARKAFRLQKQRAKARESWKGSTKTQEGREGADRTDDYPGGDG